MDTNPNSHNFFESLMAIKPPFSITSIKESFTETEPDVIFIDLEYDRGHQPELTGYEFVRIHDWENRSWQHLRIFQYPCYIRCRMPKCKYRDKETGKEVVRIFEAPWTRKGSGFSLLFESELMKDIKRTGCVATTAKGFDLVSQLVLKAFGKTRMAIARRHKTSFNKWVFLKPNLSQQEFHIREDFFDLWKQKPQDAPGFLKYWIDRCSDFSRKKMRTLGNRLLEHFEGIINALESGLTNGLLEGLNEKNQTMKRKARGYKNNTTFMKMIWVHCNGYTFST